MAAFALGLIGDAAAAPRSPRRSPTPSPLVRGRAAEALGLIGAKDAAAAIGALAAEYARHAAVTAMAPDDETWPAAAGGGSVQAGAVRARAARRLRAAGRRRARRTTGRCRSWWPVAFALQRINDPRARAGAHAARRGSGQVHRRVRGPRARRARRIRPPRPALLPLLDGKRPLEVHGRGDPGASRQIGRRRGGRAAQAHRRRSRRRIPNLRLEAVDGARRAEGHRRRCRSCRI